jgi:hypothetical protein
MADLPTNEDLKVLEIDDLGDDVFGPAIAAFLFFDFNSKELKEAHKEFLSTKATAFLTDPIGFAEMYAYTDTKGTDQVNAEFAAARLHAVQNFLFQQGVPADKAFDPFNHKSFGEQAAKESDPDETEDQSFRLVCVGLWKDPFKVRLARFSQFKPFSFGRAHEPEILEF